MALFQNGRLREAVDNQKRALSLLPLNTTANARDTGRFRLQRYPKALDEKSEGKEKDSPFDSPIKTSTSSSGAANPFNAQR